MLMRRHKANTLIPTRYRMKLAAEREKMRVMQADLGKLYEADFTFDQDVEDPVIYMVNKRLHALETKVKDLEEYIENMS